MLSKSRVLYGRFLMNHKLHGILLDIQSTYNSLSTYFMSSNQFYVSRTFTMQSFALIAGQYNSEVIKTTCSLVIRVIHSFKSYFLVCSVRYCLFMLIFYYQVRYIRQNLAMKPRFIFLLFIIKVRANEVKEVQNIWIWSKCYVCAAFERKLRDIIFDR